MSEPVCPDCGRDCRTRGPGNVEETCSRESRRAELDSLREQVATLTRERDKNGTQLSEMRKRYNEAANLYQTTRTELDAAKAETARLAEKMRELRGFAERNWKRAEANVDALRKKREHHGKVADEAYARLHEAGRVKMVVCDGVDATLANTDAPAWFRAEKMKVAGEAFHAGAIRAMTAGRGDANERDAILNAIVDGVKP